MPTNIQQADYHELSDCDGGTVTFKTPAGRKIVATVTEIALDEHGVWLFVQYLTFNADCKALYMTAWMNVRDCTLVSKKQTAAQTAVTEIAAIH